MTLWKLRRNRWRFDVILTQSQRHLWAEGGVHFVTSLVNGQCWHCWGDRCSRRSSNRQNVPLTKDWRLCVRRTATSAADIRRRSHRITRTIADAVAAGHLAFDGIEDPSDPRCIRVIVNGHCKVLNGRSIPVENRLDAERRLPGFRGGTRRTARPSRVCWTAGRKTLGSCGRITAGRCLGRLLRLARLSSIRVAVQAGVR